MNRAVENRYEKYTLDANWNLTPIEHPVKMTNYVISDHVYALLRLIYGSLTDPEDIPSLPPNWGAHNPDIVDNWMDVALISHEMQFELGITGEHDEFEQDELE